MQLTRLTPGSRAAVRSARCRTPLAPVCVAQPATQARRPTATQHDDVAAVTNFNTLFSAGLVAPWVAALPALAEEGGHDILKGTTAALVHPAVMFALFGGSVYAGYLGWQYRRTRTLGEEIRALKAQIPAVAEGEAAAPSPLATQVAALEKERKELMGGGYKDRHQNAGSWLLGAGVAIAVEGCLNTYTRTGKLFPGPHLFAGAAIVVLWALAAALVPAMQKGNNTARSAHIALNALNVGLFVWQIPTGLEIVGKVFQFTTFP